MKDKALANIYGSLLIHDMSKILQNIKSSSELSFEFFKDPKKFCFTKKLIESITQQATRGFKLISNVINLSKIENNTLFLKKVEIIEILNSSVNIVELPIQNNMQIKIDCPFAEIFIKANDLLQDVFENLLLNAVIHNNSPIVKILIRISKFIKKKSNFVKIEFIDNGIGISNERKKSIFKKERNIQNGGKGMGFGLSLIKRLIDIYNGEIKIENRVKGDINQGSNFILIFPEA